jgi:thioredoxin-related protein
MRRRAALLLAACTLLATAAGHASEPLPLLLDWQADAAQATREGKPLVLFFSLPGCVYCAVIRRNYLASLLRDTPAHERPILREADMTGDAPIVGLDGAATTPAGVARRYGVKVAPTVIFVDGAGRLLADPIIGGDTAGLYGGLLDNAIEESARRLGGGAKH